MSVHVVVTKSVPKENQQRWLEMANELSEATWKEEGCITYYFLQQEGNRFLIVEEWESMPHLEAHFKTEHFTRLVPLMDGISETLNLDVCKNALQVQRFPIQSMRKGRILVLFDSSTDCTTRMAKYIVEGANFVSHMEVRLRAVPGPANFYDKSPGERQTQGISFATHDDVNWADGIACGSPTNLGSISWRMKKFWDDYSQSGHWAHVDGKLACSFSSQGGHAGGAELCCMTMNHVLMNFGFSCFGITDYVGFKNTLHYGACNAKAPRDEIDILACRRQGTRLAEFVGYYILRRDSLHPLVASKAYDLMQWGYPGIPPRDATIDKLSKCNEEGGRFGSSMAGKIRTFNQHRNMSAVVKPDKKVLVFTKMEDYVHGSTAAAASFVTSVCTELGMKCIVSDDSSLLEIQEDGSPKMDFDLIVLVQNSGQIFDPSKEALSAHLKQGKGVLGIHAALASFLNGKDASGATLMEPTTHVIESIFKAHFKNHPPVQKGTVNVNRSHADALGLTANLLPDTFSHEDEFFNFGRNPDPSEITVVASVDESSYTGGLMGETHPVVWHYNRPDSGAPVFYCALGHFAHFYNGLGDDKVANIIRAGIHFCVEK